MAPGGALLRSHAAASAALAESGVWVAGHPALGPRDLRPQVLVGWLARAVNATMYALRTSARGDW
eukprot:gene8503-4_t